MDDCRGCRARVDLDGSHPCYGGTSSTYWVTRLALRGGRVWCPEPATYTLGLVTSCRCTKNMNPVPMCTRHAEHPTIPDLDLSRYRPEGWPDTLVCAGCGTPVSFTEPAAIPSGIRLDPCAADLYRRRPFQGENP